MAERARLDLNLSVIPLNDRKVIQFPNFLFQQIKLEKGINVKNHLAKLITGLKDAEENNEWVKIITRLIGVTNPAFTRSEA
jgi:hypothetical protein